MARTVNEEEYAEKRNGILDAALRLVYTKGFERMTIQDILAELHISSGAFYHYFDSKAAVLKALIERMQPEVEGPLLAIIRDPDLPAIDKLQRFLTTLDRLRMDQHTVIAGLLHVWFSDDNAIVREKVDEGIIERRAPLFADIVRQGIREGVFATSYPDQAGEVIVTLLQRMGNTHARLLVSLMQGRDEEAYIERIVTTHAAYMEAIERVLGAPASSLHRTDAGAVRVWVAALYPGEGAVT
jgi:AcrR family transcriptional regulator